MTARARATIIPQRHNGKGWHDCSAHQATGWLVVTAAGKRLARFERLSTAKQLARQEDAASSRSKPYRLGSRMPQAAPPGAHQPKR